MINIFGEITKGVIGLGKDYFKGRKKKVEAKLELELAEINNKTRLMGDAQSNNHAWEMAALKQSGKELKWISFSLFSAPIVLTMFGQYIGFDSNSMWASLNTVPQWWQNIFVGANATIWGTLQMRDMGGMRGIVAAFKKDKE